MNSAMGYTEGAEVPEDKTDNELIAQFMGHGWGDFEKKHLDYEGDWNLLMVVVEKINGMGYDALILCNGIHTEKHSCDITTTGDVYAATTSKSLIETVYKAVVEFIKWYNQQKLKTRT